MPKLINKAPLIFFLLMVAVIILLFADVWAGSECDKHGNCADGDVLVDIGSTNLNIKGDKSRVYAFSHSLGDVDINDYIVTKAKGNALWSWQNYDYNFWAMADRADLGGKSAEAAEIRCMVKDIQEQFGERCIVAMTFIPVFIESPTEIRDTEDDDDDLRYAAQQEENLYLREQLAVVVKQVEQKVTPRIVDTGAAKRRAQTRAILEEGKTDD